MSNVLTVYDQFDELQRAAIALHQSGFFPDVKSQAQAIVKVMAGAELGLPPFASMTGVHIIQGKPVLGANVLATLVKNDPRYNYQIKQATNEVCELEWYEAGSVGRTDRKVGTSTFTIKEAQTAGLMNKDNWKKYPSDMLFARAISRGARRFAPGIFGGSPIYTPEELGAEIDEEGNVIVETIPDVEIVEAEVTDPEPKPNGKSWKPEFVEGLIDNNIAEHPKQAVAILNLLMPETVNDAIKKGKIYRGWRDSGKEVEDAAQLTIEGNVPK